MRQYLVKSLAETKKVAKEIASGLVPGKIVTLTGDLGAGKTTLVQLICKELEVSEYVNSPTFTIVNEYESGKWKVNHIDFYRVKHTDELLEIGMDQYFNDTDVTFIEWAELFEEILPEKIVRVNIETLANERRITIDD
ncbi:MAG: tRNA (adenosine(37)-N6)-threonylcarbamoyltransferase complex ATPase subunit type 1 TsaE [Candidatus Margulisbacteria bacterium]|nr:tRNA (adenosine(37)-N6)-threonylcarbamoyltransferase complex ATPase subunit type 1 TsaE [Candidatus Margulisiibacteriota bacterium]